MSICQIPVTLEGKTYLLELSNFAPIQLVTEDFTRPHATKLSEKTNAVLAMTISIK